MGSTIARESNGGIYTHAGPEIGVASTKAFTTQVTVLILLTILFARKRNLPAERGRELLEALALVPEQLKLFLETD